MKDKNVCVISAYGYIVKNINYGSLLQYYALEKYLKKIGYNASLLRFIPSDNENKIKKLIKKYRDFIFHHYSYKKKDSVLKSFKEFIIKNIHVSDLIYHSIDDLRTNLPNAEYFITGSDQVWGGTLEANYLTFVPSNYKKFSYAASFGKSKISNEQKDIIKPWLEKLNKISVREESGIEICNEMGIEAISVIDPTLLLSQNEYPVVYADSNKILCYFLNINDYKEIFFNEIYTLAKKQNFRLKYVGGVSKVDNFVNKNYLDFYSPEEFLSNYLNAKYIVTNSFHGVVFSIIFKKRFAVLLQKGKMAKQNERILAILKKFNLTEKICSDVNALETTLNIEVDWNNVSNLIEKEREKSLKYLFECFKHDIN